MYDKQDLDRIAECLPNDEKFKELATIYLDADIKFDKILELSPKQKTAFSNLSNYLSDSKQHGQIKEAGTEEKFLLADMVVELKNSPIELLQKRKDNFIQDPYHTFTHTIPEAARLALADLKKSPRAIVDLDDKNKIPEAVKQAVRQSTLEQMSKLDANIERVKSITPRANQQGYGR